MKQMQITTKQPLHQQPIHTQQIQPHKEKKNMNQKLKKN